MIFKVVIWVMRVDIALMVLAVTCMMCGSRETSEQLMRAVHRKRSSLELISDFLGMVSRASTDRPHDPGAAFNGGIHIGW